MQSVEYKGTFTATTTINTIGDYLLRLSSRRPEETEGPEETDQKEQTSRPGAGAEEKNIF